ncbi:polypeptide N-acetylgalactosaminyltransferase 1 [Ischnura elegans]|uniref:polypeptide N-acetylgalactosaminyltransferase 1 n=1 Tax=Ischnura elegans TaxID=197161 RepID=UPI001ED8664E|nr:polypeptide N-acetylgalactosaminyltransferase 1 [Ischnura elegans]
MVAFVRWRRWARILVFAVSLFVFIIFAGGVNFKWNHSREGNAPTSKRLPQHDQNERNGEGNIRVIVGHYAGEVGKSGFPLANLTPEFLNENHFSPEPGEGRDGHPVIIPPKDMVQMHQLYPINRFNLLASDRIPLNRSLPDVRRKKCQEYYNESQLAEDLPKVSVVIVFHNEAWSTLLRTVMSVVNRSPRTLLKEIILVDDASEREFLGRPLEEYLKGIAVPTRVLRTHVRSGLVRARLLGARAAIGGVLVFLDAHCECTTGWLEPLVLRVAEERTRVVCPVIDIINDITFAYVRSFELHWGAFNWHLHFRWYALGREDIQKRKKNIILPFKTPVMAGGLFAIDRNYFFEIGSYDEDMDIWGGENLEMSFRVWQCGGSVEIAPCSHVGHLFRKSSPYSFPGGIGDVLYTNLARVALVWMDEWAEFFFHVNPEAAKLKNSVSVTKRLQLRRQLHCRNFHWFLNAIWPEHFFPMDDRFFGQVRQHNGDTCLQKPPGGVRQPVGHLAVGKCADHTNVSSSLSVLLQQLFVFTPSGAVMTDESVCLDSSVTTQQLEKPNLRVTMLACTGTNRQKWVYDKTARSLVHSSTGLCLDVQSRGSGGNSSSKPQDKKTPATIVALSHCMGKSTQQWILDPVPWK